MIRLVSLTASLAMAAGFAFAAGDGGSMVKTSASGYFTDGHDMTLYVFDKDAAGTSNCNGKCAELWPPLVLAEGEKLPEGFETVSRQDGTQQVAYKGQPLYLWVKDTEPGQTTGDGVKGVWHIAMP